MNRPPIPCHLCAKFTIAGHDQAASRGEGWCDSWEKYRRHDDDNAACVFFEHARDERRRRAWAEKHNQKTEAK